MLSSSFLVCMHRAPIVWFVNQHLATIQRLHHIVFLLNDRGLEINDQDLVL